MKIFISVAALSFAFVSCGPLSSADSDVKKVTKDKVASKPKSTAPKLPSAPVSLPPTRSSYPQSYTTQSPAPSTAVENKPVAKYDNPNTLYPSLKNAATVISKADMEREVDLVTPAAGSGSIITPPIGQ